MFVCAVREKRTTNQQHPHANYNIFGNTKNINKNKKIARDSSNQHACVIHIVCIIHTAENNAISVTLLITYFKLRHNAYGVTKGNSRANLRIHDQRMAFLFYHIGTHTRYVALRESIKL